MRLHQAPAERNIAVMEGQPVRTSDAVVFLPGIMGSELTDARGKVVWGMKPSLLFRELRFRDVVKRLALNDDASDDGVRPTGLLRWPVKLPLLGSTEPYGEMVKRLEATVEPGALMIFPYDWRRSIAFNAERLRTEARDHLRTWRAANPHVSPPPALTFVCHSMGGLVARHAVEVLADDLKGDVRQIVTLGTPFRGAVKALRILATGEYLKFGLLAGQLRDSGRTMPGLYELVARYRCLDDGGTLRALTPSDLAAIGAHADRAEAAFAVMDALHAAGARPGTTPVRPMVGLSQPTLQSARIVNGEATFEERLGERDESGDGTVFRRAAAPNGTTPAYLPQTHGAITRSAEALTFVAAVLTEQALGPLQAEPTGIGVRVPEAVMTGEPISVEIFNPGGGPVACHLQDTETGTPIAMAVTPADGRLVASRVAPSPGLYRIVVAGGGLSPVRDLVAVLSPDDAV
jgi:Lecithin:cholesterol acyltransferase